MGYLYRPKLKSGARSSIIWCKYYDSGKAVRESTGATTEPEARRFLKLREGAVATGAPIPPRVDRIRYDELRDDLVTFYKSTGKWKNMEDVEHRLAHLDGFFKGSRAAGITPDVIAKYVEQRQAETTHLVAERDPKGEIVARRRTSNATINRELALLRRMLRLAVKRRKLLSLPVVEMLQEAPARAGFFEDEQYHAVVQALPEDLRAAVVIAHTYGWRMRSEILPLERRHLDLRTGTLRLEPGTTKNKDARVVYLTPELKALLAAQLERVDELQRELKRIVPHLFPHFEGAHRGEPRRGFRKAWRAACTKAGVPGRLPHDFRRTAVRNMERAGVPRSVAMKLTGHKTEAVYRRYAIVSDADLQDATRRLSALTQRAGTFSGTLHSVGVAPVG